MLARNKEDHGRRVCRVLLKFALCAGLAAAAPVQASDQARVCLAVSELRERLEGVTEAVIDGRPTRVPDAAEHAAAWWTTHRGELAATPALDSLVERMQAEARHARPRSAAAAAVRLSVASLAWCPAPPTDNDRLLLLDLAGMTGWLRARGQSLEWPSGVQGAKDTLMAHLETRRERQLAVTLDGAVAAVLATPVRKAGDQRTATALLELVDRLERILH